MFRRIADFISAWDYEIEATEKVFGNLTDESLAQRVTDDGRTLGRIAWHIVQTLPEMAGRTGLEVAGPGEEEATPATAAEIRAAFKEAAEGLKAQVGTWGDADLDVEDDMYGQMWTRSQTLWALVGHQIHHRGQMTVLMRQAGLLVPGVFGPAKEEWSAYGMPPQE